jgi:hypothetical protein
VEGEPRAAQGLRSWAYSAFPPSFDMPKPVEIDPVIIKAIYEERYKGNPGNDPIAHLEKFQKDVTLLRLIMLAMIELNLRCFLTRLLLDHWIGF